MGCLILIWINVTFKNEIQSSKVIFGGKLLQNKTFPANPVFWNGPLIQSSDTEVCELTHIHSLKSALEEEAKYCKITILAVLKKKKEKGHKFSTGSVSRAGVLHVTMCSIFRGHVIQAAYKCSVAQHLQLVFFFFFYCEHHYYNGGKEEKHQNIDVLVKNYALII